MRRVRAAARGGLPGRGAPRAPARRRARRLPRVRARTPRLFDQYDNDGYSLAVSPRCRTAALELRVRVSGGPLESRAPYPDGRRRAIRRLPASPERDAFARDARRRTPRTQAEAVERILSGIASAVRYDADRARRQDPGLGLRVAARALRRLLAELAVDLLRRVGIPAADGPGHPARAARERRLRLARSAGVYHRWIEIYYPDRGFVFSDPSASINGVDARYVPFGRRALERPRGLTADAASRPRGGSTIPCCGCPTRRSASGRRGTLAARFAGRPT